MVLVVIHTFNNENCHSNNTGSLRLYKQNVFWGNKVVFSVKARNTFAFLLKTIPDIKNFTRNKIVDCQVSIRMSSFHFLKARTVYELLSDSADVKKLPASPFPRRNGMLLFAPQTINLVFSYRVFQMEQQGAPSHLTENAKNLMSGILPLDTFPYICVLVPCGNFLVIFF